MPKVLLVKHGITDWDIVGKTIGSRDIPLNPQGNEKTKELAEKLKEATIQEVFASKLSRSFDTAKAIAKSHQLEVEADELLNEMNQGRWTELTKEEARKLYPIHYGRWEKNPIYGQPPAGENVFDVLERVNKFWYKNVANKRGTIVIVVHEIVGAIFKLFLRELKKEIEAKKELKNLWKYVREQPEIEEIMI